MPNESAEQHIKIDSELLTNMFNKVITTGNVEVFKEPGGTLYHSVYPAFDATEEIFAILIYTAAIPHFADQKMTHGILKVYSNYLALLDKTERDKLTGLYNRETLENRIIEILINGRCDKSSVFKFDAERRLTERTSTFLALVDIDYFKSINDGYGHLYGDEILVLVARIMMANFARSDDFVFRYGGEEFVVLAKAKNIEDAFHTFERLSNNIQRYAFPQVGQVTVSIGFDEITNQQSPQDIISTADKALYYAKNSGRNCTENYLQLLNEQKIQPTQKIESQAVTFF